MMKMFLSLGLSILLAGALVPAAWAEEERLESGPGEGFEKTERSFAIEETSAESQVGNAARASDGWEEIGSCEWGTENGSDFVLRPADGLSIGYLPSASELEMDPYGDVKWPWIDSDPLSFTVEGTVVCGSSVRRMFSNCFSLASLDVSGLDTSSVTDMSGMFSSCRSLASLDVSGLDTSSVTYMSDMFSYCSSLASLDVSGLDTSSVTDMSGMFSSCRSLASLDVSGLDTSSVTYMSEMFSGCSSLASLDVSGLDTSSVANMSSMFSGCSSLASLDVSGLDTSSVANMSSMFSNCPKLASLDLSSFNSTRIPNTKMAGMFDDCSSLNLVRVGERCTVQSQLPDKTWYNAAGEAFSPSTIPLCVAGTYVTTADPLQIRLSETTKTLSVGASRFRLEATVTPAVWAEEKVVWSSSDPSVAVVDSDGQVTVHDAGRAIITAEVGGVKAQCDLTVLAATTDNPDDPDNPDNPDDPDNPDNPDDPDNPDNPDDPDDPESPDNPKDPDDPDNPGSSGNNPPSGADNPDNGSDGNTGSKPGDSGSGDDDAKVDGGNPENAGTSSGTGDSSSSDDGLAKGSARAMSDEKLAQTGDFVVQGAIPLMLCDSFALFVLLLVLWAFRRRAQYW
ncbi:BspA family leucine-rich repeat surface protein [Adlercreutzia equolifaciens]|uniref:BspA family leucine-rich repeat surface protein n=1 Tax=Adlercreutzia equolifaciens TaxID=446660 RepID=UPI001C7020DA|nr:BspA family leucine-rich repeat surface protein [Adlercreutzia equolifaciens]